MTESELREQLYKSLIEPHKKSGLIPVTYLIYDCPRRGFYSETYGDFFDAKTLALFWIGRAIHDKPVLGGETEVELRSDGIIGRIDEYKDGTLLEKKTCKMLPSRPNDHYIKQIEYYCWLLSKNKKPVKDCWLLSIQLTPPAFRFFQVRPRELPEIEKEILSRAKAIKEGLGGEKRPERKIGWLCDYCSFASVCFKE